MLVPQLTNAQAAPLSALTDLTSLVLRQCDG